MKQQLATTLKTSFLLLMAGLLIVQTASAGPGDGDKPAKKSKMKNKAFSSLNNAAVKIYPDAIRREMHVIAKENGSSPVDLFVFDVEGTLVQNHKMQSGDHVKISGLNRGMYIYRVFNGDTEAASGKFEIR